MAKWYRTIAGQVESDDFQDSKTMEKALIEAGWTKQVNPQINASPLSQQTMKLTELQVKELGILYPDRQYFSDGTWIKKEEESVKEEIRLEVPETLAPQKKAAKKTKQL